MAKYLDPKADLMTIHIPSDLLEDKNVSKAVELVQESAYTEEELYTIDRYRDAVSRKRTAMAEKFEQGHANGMKKGIEIGEARGIEIGEARGEARGIEIGETRERQKAHDDKLASARMFKSIGVLTNKQIADSLGLTEDEIKGL